MSAAQHGPMRETATDYEVVAVNPETGEHVWVSISSEEAATWQAGVMPDGEHGRFVQKPVSEVKPVDWDQKPVLMWAGMQTLESSPSGLALEQEAKRRAGLERRWLLVDKKTGSSSRAYTLPELQVRLAKRARSTLARKQVYDNVTQRKFRALNVADYPHMLDSLVEQREVRG